MPQSIFQKDALAVVTGAASGIGLAASRHFLSLGMKVVMIDWNGETLSDVADQLFRANPEHERRLMALEGDVSDPASLASLKARISDRFGTPQVLMNNAGIQPGSSLFGPQEAWDRVLSVNLMGVIHGTRAFGPDMIASGKPGVIINTGSKQGITTPPGDPAYNVSKAGVKVFTEALQHELRNTPDSKVTAHLLIPGFVYTSLTANGRTEKPEAAWTPEQTVSFMMESLARGDFYILCPDNDVPRALDEKRIFWAAHDIIDNRPPLSRWHKDFAEAFTRFVKGE